jgi:hypothetical protein
VLVSSIAPSAVGGGFAPAAELCALLRHEVAICTAGRRRKRRSSHDVVSSVSALRGRHWQRWGLKHAVAVGPVSRTRERLRGMKGMDNGSEALTLRIVTSAELKRLKGSRPKKGRGPSAGDFNGRPPHVACPPVYRGVLTLLCTSRNVVSRTRSPGRCKAVRPGVARPQGRGTAEPVKDAGGSEGRPVIGRIEGDVSPHAERRLTSRGCDRTKKTRQIANRGSVYHG